LATNQLVSSLDRQAVLEDLLEATKTAPAFGNRTPFTTCWRRRSGIRR